MPLQSCAGCLKKKACRGKTDIVPCIPRAPPTAGPWHMRLPHLYWTTVARRYEACSAMYRGTLDRAIMQKQILYHPSGKPNLEFMYRCLIDIAAGMDYLHSLGVINGDLKPANVLLKSTHEDARGFTCKVHPSILKHHPSVVLHRPFLLVTICGRPLAFSVFPCASPNLLICRRRLQT